MMPKPVFTPSKATNDYTYTVKVTDGVATVTAEANAKEEA